MSSDVIAVPASTSGSSAAMMAVSGAHVIRLLLADVDETLLTKAKILTEGAKSAVRGLPRAGVLFAITS